MPLVCLFFLCPHSSFAQNTKQQIASEMKSSLEMELLEVWYPKSVDTSYGGFLSSFTFDGKRLSNQDKMIVTQARHIWSNARAAEIYPEKKYYLESARQGFLFLRDHCWDQQYGGFPSEYKQDGTLKPSGLGDKTAYGNAFAIYGLAAYYRVSKDTSALHLAIKTFQWLEKHSHDPRRLGYFQHLDTKGRPVQRTAATPSLAETGYKDQNSSIHLLEAFTELYGVWPNELLKQRLREMFLLIRDRITDPMGHLILFFTPDWQPLSYRDSSEQCILSHHSLDHVSFGHDVETAYLLLEAAGALGMKDDPLTLRKAKRMVDHAIDNGWDSTVGGFFDEGYYFRGEKKIRIIRDSKNWWAQAEGLNALLMMADYYPQDSLQYFEKFQQLWSYTKAYLIDHQWGDWYPGGIDKEPFQQMADKGNVWKGSYHNFRSLQNCIERLERSINFHP